MTQTDTAYDIAVTGYACRLPQARSPEAFWQVLTEGRCVISQIGQDRFETGLIHDPDPAARGKSYTLAAGQIDGAWEFDPGFFSISPREAVQMDPQHRILLQTVWEALEHAGIRASDLEGERTGVFVGASSSDYSNHFFMDLSRIDAQFMTGNTLSIISNRISYLLNLKGPSFTVDTACSSSFYALHEGCRALMAGDIDTAIVGGVNLLMSPAPFVGFSRASMLSPTGLCRAFDAKADGYVRSEGAVVFVLRRLGMARAAGNRVRSILIGSGINSDGRTVGMALPSTERQAALLTHMRDRFGLDPDDLAFVEAHGTGTPVGDPVEAQAIGRVLGQPRATPLPIGSAKTNFGHLEPTSGLVGLLKAQMALERGVLPPSLHVETPNPHIDFDGLNLHLTRQALPLAERSAPWIAGVNSFGFGGANAHVLLRQPEACERTPAGVAPPPRALPISAAGTESLSRLASAWRDRIAATAEADLPALVNAAAWGRDTLPHRLIVLGETREALVTALDDHLAGRRSPRLATGRSTRATGRTAFVFSGNGAQWPGMGRHLHVTNPVFRARFDEIADLFARRGGEDLRALLLAEDLGARLGGAAVAQPILFAVQMALVAALGAEGLVPHAVAGHSVGEVAAACTAGIITLRDAVLLVQTRSAALDTLRGTGGMAAVSASAAEVAQALEASGLTGICIAGINSPRSVTVSGDREALKALLAHLRKTRRVAGVMLEVEHPYHSPAVEPLRRRMIEDLKALRPTESAILYASSTTGQMAHGLSLDTDYWWRNAREVVRFDDAVETLCDAGCQCFVEISPRPVLANYVREKLRSLGHSGTVARTLDQGAAATLSALEIAALAHAEGARVDPARLFGPKLPVSVDLPGYPWTNTPWRAEVTREAANNWGQLAFHPLLGRAYVPGQTCWQGDMNPRTLPWLADHVVDGATVFPAAGFVEMALAAGALMLGRSEIELSEFDILRPLVLDGPGGVETRTTADPFTGAFRIEARPRLSDTDWAPHAVGTLRALPAGQVLPVAGPDAAASVSDGAGLYVRLAARGLAYGPAFARTLSVRSATDRAEADLQPEGRAADARLVLNPTGLDAALHAVFPLILAGAGSLADEDTVFLPVRVGRLRLLRPHVAATRAQVQVTRQSLRGVELSVSLTDAAGALIAVAERVRLQATRLRGRGGRDGLVWAQRLVRLRAGDARVALPKGWNTPAARLRALGLATETEADPDAGALLVDAACRRIAWEVVAAQADAGGRLSPVPLGVAPGALPLLDRLRRALAEDGALADGRLSPACPYPALPDLMSSMVREAPERAAEILDLMRLETGLPDLLCDGLRGESAGAGIDLAAGTRALWSGAARILTDLAAHWPDTERLSVLLMGAVPPMALEGLIASGRVDSLTIAAEDERQADLMRRTLPHLPALSVVLTAEALVPLAHDVVLVVDNLGGLDEERLDRLSESLALGGLLFAFEPVPCLARDMFEGRAAAWWGRRQPGAGDWAALLAPGFRDVSVQAAASGAVEAMVISARPRQQAVRANLPAAEAGQQRSALILLADRSAGNLALSALIEASLTAAGVAVRRGLADETPTSWGPAVEVIHLAGIAEPGGPVLAGAEARIATLRQILGLTEGPRRIWTVTRGGRPATLGRSATEPVVGHLAADAAVWGALRVLGNEYPGTDFRVVDFAPDIPPEGLAEDLCARLLSTSPETEVTVTAEGAFVPRVEPMAQRALMPHPGGALRLDVGQQGALDSLAWIPAARRAPGPGEVEIEVKATGLNFRDLMWAQGLLPEEALQDGFAGATLGMECSGTVLRAGRESGFRRGETVIAFAPSCFATHVTVAAEAVAALPAGTSPDTAAAVPTIFVTAWYALARLAALRAGETLLVHGGAGGVGLAALQIARGIGARVFATAGSPAKRRLLSRLGAEAVFDSRSLGFAEEVMAATGGTGVDVVLNSLAGEAMERSLGCLRPFGRFIELGKRDFYANSRIGLRPFSKNLSYFGVDADQLLRDRPDLAGSLLEDIARGFTDGRFAPPPCQVFESSEIVDAFRLMQQSRHIGKIVVRPPRVRVEAAPLPVAPIRDGWLVTGGLGGFGLATADWLAARGASQLWLVSRTGRARPEDQAALDALIARGVRVEIRAADVTDAPAMRSLMHEIEAGEVPLRGVVHAAMVLRDALSADLTAEAIHAVMAPKLAGALVLDAVTRDCTLDHFLLYSSVTTLFGNPGQLAYVAANTALESLAAARRQAGLPGLAVAWGPIADQGYLTRETRTRDLLDRRLGTRMLTAAEALDTLGQFLAAGLAEPAVTIAPMRWRALAADLRLLSTPLFSRIELGEAGLAEGVASLLAELEGLPDEAATQKVIAALTSEAARILRQSVADIDAYQPLTELGFDSLMAMDLKIAAEEALGVAIPLLSIGDGMTLAQLSARILAQLRGKAQTVTGDTEGDRMVSQHLGEAPGEIDADIVRRVTERAESIRQE